MAYNNSKGPREFGDLKNEEDTDTQLDWDYDYIGLKTGGSTRFVISGSVVGIGTTTPDTAAMLNISKDVDSEFVALKLTNESDAADTTGKVSLQFDLEDSSGNTVDAGKITVEKESGYTSDPPTQDSSMVFATSLNGTLGTSMTLDSQSKLTLEGEIEVKKDSSFGATGQSRYFTVKSTGNASMLRVDGAQDCVGIGLGSPTHTLTVSGELSGSGQATLGNNLHVSGDIYTGGAFNVSGVLTPAGNVLPSGDLSQNLGSPSKRWANIYTGDLHLKNERGDWTVIEEENYLTLRNNKTGKRFKLSMEEID